MPNPYFLSLRLSHYIGNIVKIIQLRCGVMHNLNCESNLEFNHPLPNLNRGIF